MVSPKKLERLDRRITRWLAANSLTILRISLGIVFFWFGLLKFFPAASPAEELAGRTIQTLTFGLVPPAVSVPVLATWETLIGLGLISGLLMRATLLLLLLQMAGTVMPLFLFPSETFTRPFVPNLEGQYIIKNIVLVAAALTIGSTVRGGYIKPEPTPEPR